MPVSESDLSDYLAKYEVGMQRIAITPEVLTASYQLARLTPIKFSTMS